MNGILLLTMLTMPGQDTEWGFMKTPQGIEYIVQIEPQVIQSMVDGKEVYSVVPQEMHQVDIGRIRLHHGSGKLTEDDVSSTQSVQDVRFGCQPLLNGGMEFIVQILPSGVREFQNGRDVIVEIPRERTQPGATTTRPAIRGIRKFTVRIGTDRLPQIPNRSQNPGADPAPAPPSSVTTTSPAPIVDPNNPNPPANAPPYGSGSYQPYTPPGTTPPYTSTPPPYTSTPPPYAPGYNDPRTTDPRTTDPRTTDPRYTDPRYADPRYDPRYADPRYGDPRYTDPRYRDPRTTDPRTTDPRYTGLAGQDPYPTQPYAAGSPPIDYRTEPPRGTTAPRPNAPAGPVPDPAPPTIATTNPNTVVTPAVLAAAAEPAEKPYVPMLVTSLALIASLGGNLFLGWVAMGLYDRYRRALTDMRDQSRRVARA